jgi:hypothetical protein
MLKDQIQNLHKIIAGEIRNISYGGCIHFAYYCSKRFKELNIPHSVYLFDYVPVYNNYKHFESVTHVGIYTPETGGFDGLNFKDFKKIYDYKRKVTLNLDKLRNDYEWCHIYDTSQNERLEQLINTYINGN